jgi:hypothetical protein
LRSRLELVEQTRLADTGVGHHSDDLTVSRLSLFGRVLQCLHLTLTPDEFGQTARGRTLKPGARVALAIMDPDNSYRFVQIRGRVTSATENGADSHIDSLAKKYLGQDKYPFRGPGEVRVMYEIEPTSASGNG